MDFSGAQEQPLMACTTRTYQRIMENALSEQWWPLMHNSEGTFGSIDLGYKYDELMNSLRCSSKGSCVEKGLDHLGKDNLKEILENSSAKEAGSVFCAPVFQRNNNRNISGTKNEQIT